MSSTILSSAPVAEGSLSREPAPVEPPVSVHSPASLEPTGTLETPIKIRLALVAAGLLLLGVSAAGKALRPAEADFFTLFAMAGLALAAVPVLVDSLGSLKSDGFQATKYYMDQFVALAVLACFAAGQYATGAVVAAILIVGQVLEERAVVGVEEAVGSLLRLARTRARRLRADGSEERVESAELRAGDVVRVLPGDLVPADGSILRGRSTLDQSAITGESLPVEASAGDAVFAGTTNGAGVLEIQVRETGDRTVIGRVRSIVEEAKASRAPVMRLIDDYTRYYMPLILAIAGLVLFFTRDVNRAISVIIVAMPCAFVLASPSAMVAALACASRMGLLVKSARFFEAAAEIDTVVFDKTGTLTTGRLRVAAVRSGRLGETGLSAEETLALAASLAAASSHPVSQALVEEAARRGMTAEPATDVEELIGRGVRGRVGGSELLLGRLAWLKAEGISLPERSDEAEEKSQASSVHLARDGRSLGTIFLTDTLRAEAREAKETLQALGVDKFVMLTGDRRDVAAEIARESGFDDWRAECLPEQKLAEVRRLTESGRRVLVVGDGVNDAPALAAGRIGVAMGALGSDVAIQTADVALMGNDLRLLPRFLELSDRTLAIINQNVLWGLGFIALFIALSALGWISPVGAALIHEASAFFVILNSARLLRFDDRYSKSTTSRLDS